MSRGRRLASLVPHLRGRLSEFALPAADRCGNSLVVGAVRMLAAGARQLRSRTSTAIVPLEDGASVAVDLRTPHGRRLFAYGFCEPAARAMRSLLRPGDVMIDAGANIGLFTVLAATRVGPRGRVIACEPSPATMELLRDNVGRNGFDWVELQEVALADEPGRLEMHVFEPGSGFSSFAPAETSGSSRIEVPVTTLDEVACEFLDRARLVKLDVEGAELRALRGAQALFMRARPDFIVELEPEHLERQGSSLADLQALFDDAGYVGFLIGDNGLVPLRGDWLRPAGDPNVVVRPREREDG
jgi:FkbM family methyltransferase